MPASGYTSRKWRTALAMELTCPGVPVTACASMRPCASNTPAERSPASRTEVLNAVRTSVCACSSTTAIRRLHMIWVWSCASSAFGRATMLSPLSACGGAELLDQRVLLCKTLQLLTLLDHNSAGLCLDPMRCKRVETARKILRGHAQEGSEQTLLKRQHNVPGTAGTCVGLQDPVGKPFGAGAQLLVLERAHEIAKAQGKLDHNRACKRSVTTEYLAHGICRDHQHAAFLQRARRHQRHLLAHHRDQDERGRRHDHLQRRLPPAVGRIHFNGAPDQHVQE